MEKTEKSTSANGKNDSDLKKYKFYRKPSIKKKGPEVKQTKTSLARLMKANPLLKKEMEQRKENIHPNTDLAEPKEQIKDISRPIVTKLAGNGPYLKSRINRQARFSSGDFIRPILSSTLLSPEAEVFLQPQDPQKTREKADRRKDHEIKNSRYNNIENRKSLSAQYLERKKKETLHFRRETIQAGHLKRRSKSLENIKKSGSCYIIKEESLIYSSEFQSLQNIENIQTESLYRATTAERDLPQKLDNCLNLEDRNNDGQADEENKENIEIVDRQSYDDLFIPNNNISYNLRSRKS